MPLVPTTLKDGAADGAVGAVVDGAAVAEPGSAALICLIDAIVDALRAAN